MFQPNRQCLHQAKARRDIHGRESYADPREISIAVVRLARSVEPTSVRADSSASRGQGEQTVVQSKILVAPPAELAFDDKIVIDGFSYRVAGIETRNTVYGRIDHYEIVLEPIP